LYIEPAENHTEIFMKTCTHYTLLGLIGLLNFGALTAMEVKKETSSKKRKREEQNTERKKTKSSMHEKSLGKGQEAMFSHNGKLILVINNDASDSTSKDNCFKLFDAETGKLLVTVKHNDRINSAAFSHDDTKLLITSSRSRLAELWDTTGRLQLVFKHKEEWVKSAAFSDNDKQILTASPDGTAILWDAPTGKPLQTFKHGGRVSSAVFSPTKNDQILTASDNGTVKLWDIQKNDKPPATIIYENKIFGDRIKERIRIKRTDFNPKGDQILVTLGNDLERDPAYAIVSLWDARTGELLQIFQHDDRVNTARFNPTGDQLLVTLGGSVLDYDQNAGTTATLWDVKTGKANQTFTHDKRVSSATFNYNGKLVITTSDDKTLKIWNAATGECLQTFKYDGRVESAVLSPNGKQALVRSWSTIDLGTEITLRDIPTI